MSERKKLKMISSLQLATPLLPTVVQQVGIRVTKSSGYLLVAGFVSTDNSMSRYDIANYVVSHLQDPISLSSAKTRSRLGTNVKAMA